MISEHLITSLATYPPTHVAPAIPPVADYMYNAVNSSLSVFSSVA